MGKALVETLNVHIEAALGEFTSAFGEWQAEKQKQAQDLQEEVLERARKGKEKAAREVMGEEGAGQKSTTATKAAMAPAVSHVSPGTSNGDPLLSFMKD
ncbi:uncharacterized protein At4g13200, chloroplastic-like isoform X1 [Magnolia sinica]|uniref:uncharacterized protein At4g13200, chloroplastic-like isoform X1 n=1 Tax=Magnolia sinica TaxID=86752 RepID=UPI002657FB5B|nr:uncharacterized protein At4g13200, chloroplastic-like isoform X1 [Magnolia sinica]